MTQRGVTQDAAMSAAVAHYRAGRTGEAEQACREILGHNAAHFEALHLLGIIALQRGQAEDAVGLLAQAAAANPSNPQPLLALGAAYQALGLADEAESQYRHALELDPLLPQAHNNIGVLHLDRAEPGAAIESFERALERQPRYVDALYNLGNAYRDTGRMAVAATHYRRALTHAPEHAEAAMNLGLALLGIGEIGDAIAALRRAVAILPGDIRPVCNLADALAVGGEWREAETHYQAALGVDPGSADIHNRLGVLYDTMGRPAQAEGSLRTALDLDDTHVEARAHLGHVLRVGGSPEEARVHYRGAIERDPHCASAIAGLGSLAADDGDLEAAAEFYRQALSTGVDFAVLHTSLADTLRALGRMDEAMGHYRDALDANAAAMGGIAPVIQAAKHVGGQDQLERLKAWIDTDSLSETDLADAHLARATILERDGRMDEALTHYAAGNRIKSRRSNYRPDEHAHFTTRIIETFDRSLLGAPAGESVVSPRPVFVVGMPRSGTSLVEQILASHSLVYGAGELPDIDQYARTLGDMIGGNGSYPECARALANDIAAQLTDRYMAAHRRRGGTAVRVIDKAPGNFHHLGLIALLFRGARIIHCHRDALDTCFSCYRTNFTGDVDLPSISNISADSISTMSG